MRGAEQQEINVQKTQEFKVKTIGIFLLTIAVAMLWSCQSIEEGARDTKNAGWEVGQAMETVGGNFGATGASGEGGTVGTSEPAGGEKYGWPWIEVEVPLYELNPVISQVLEERGYVETGGWLEADSSDFFFDHRDNSNFDGHLDVKEIRFEKACSISASNGLSHRKAARDLLAAILEKLGKEATRSGYSE